MYPIDIPLTTEEEILIFQIRQLIGDQESLYIDDVPNVGSCSRVMMNGTIYTLEEPKGYPTNIYLNTIEYTSTSGVYGAKVLGNKYIQFNTAGVLTQDSHLVVVYNHFINSDSEILNIYDTSAKFYLTGQCNLQEEYLSPELLGLSTAYVILTSRLSYYIENAVKLEDSDSKFDASRRPDAIAKLLDHVYKALKSGIELKSKCKVMSLPIFKVE